MVAPLHSPPFLQGGDDTKVKVLASVEVLPPEPTEITHDPHFKPQIVFPSIPITPVELLGIDAELNDIGWRKQGKNYVGWFQANGGMVEGKLDKQYNGDFKPYVRSPPLKVLKGKHGACFNPAGNNWYFVHFKSGNLKDPIPVLQRIQGYFDECYRRRS